ncbi:MAG: hypothetical protein WCO92_05400 [Verrucomicrobiota bacterium]
MANHRHPSMRLRRTKIDIRAPWATLQLLEKECAEAGVSRNELICRKLAQPISTVNYSSTEQTGTEPLSDELIKYVLETHYIITHQYGNSKGRRMDSLALEAAADARKKIALLSSNAGE